MERLEYKEKVAKVSRQLEPILDGFNNSLDRETYERLKTYLEDVKKEILKIV